MPNHRFVVAKMHTTKFGTKNPGVVIEEVVNLYKQVVTK